MNPDRVKGSIKLFIPLSKDPKVKFGPSISIESGFDYNSEKDTEEFRDLKRAEGWKEVSRDIEKQIEETVKSLEDQGLA